MGWGFDAQRLAGLVVGFEWRARWFAELGWKFPAFATAGFEEEGVLACGKVFALAIGRAKFEVAAGIGQTGGADF